VFRHAGGGVGGGGVGGADVATLLLGSDKLEVKFATFLRETLME
jgi:hypothetical protein